MLRSLSLSLLILLLSLEARAPVQAQPVSPKPGDPARKQIVDALRIPVQKELKQQVVFKIDSLKLQDGWAFMRGVPQRPDGKRIDYRGTPYQRAREEGVFDDWICALLRKKAGVWRVVTYQIGATDVPYVDWDRQFGAPKAILR